jgi:hypothetical protein
MIFRVNERPSRDRVGRWNSTEKQSQQNVSDHEGRIKEAKHDGLGSRCPGGVTVDFHGEEGFQVLSAKCD